MPPLIAALIGTILLTLVLVKGRRGTVYRIFCVLLLSITIWAVVTFCMRASPNTEHALPWEKVMVAIVLFIPALYYHLSVAMVEATKQKRLLLWVYLAVGAMVSLSPTNLLVQSIEVQDYGYAPIIGAAMIPVLAFTYSLLILAFYNFARGYKTAVTPQQKNTRLYIAIAMVFPFLGGILDVFPSFYPAAIFGNIAFCIVTSVAIVRHNLLDIRIVVRKGTTYLLVSALVALPYAGVIIGVSQALGEGNMPLWGYIILLLLLAFIFQPLWRRVQDWVDQRFYGRRYSYVRMLRDLIYNMPRLSDVRELAPNLLHNLAYALNIDRAYLFLSASGDDFSLVLSNEPGGLDSQVSISRDSPLANVLENNREFVYSRDFDTVPHLQALSSRDRELLLHEMGGELFVPLATKAGLIGILVLGAKSNNQPYSGDDLQILSASLPQLAVSLDNARLYEQEKQTVSELYALEEKYRTLTQELNVGVFRRTPEMDGEFLETNPALVQILGYDSEEELYRARMLALYEDPGEAREFCEQLIMEGAVKGEEVRLKKKDGTPFWGRITATLIRDEDANPRFCQGVLEDITEWKQAQDKIRASLEEKEMLLKEIHHRVKNNLQIISSLLRRQGRQMQDETLKQMLKESENRILSMSLIHEKLYHSENLAAINFRQFIRSVSHSLFRSYGAANVALNPDIEDVHLPIDTAIPCGLIVNELVSNALKYAFPEGQAGEVDIVLHSIGDGEVELVVRDNGVGIPEDIDIRNTDSLGMDLVTMLSEKQLHGKLELDRSQGTEFRIRFPLPSEERVS
ncbi:MAG: histidine kinase dimerization/phosphoacceptor domain -containing protein [Dehalococcoidia bacterium]